MTFGGVTLTRVDWYAYVRRVAGSDSDMRIAARIGVTQSTVSRWRDRSPNARHVIEFARQYGRPIPEALMEAYGLTSADLGQAEPDPGAFSNAQLLAQLVYRLGIRVDDLYAALESVDSGQVASSDRLSRQAAEQGQKPTLI